MNGKYKPVRFPVQAFYGSRACIQAPCVRISWQGILFSKQSFCNLVARLGVNIGSDDKLPNGK